jgi:hypothetical protein
MLETTLWLERELQKDRLDAKRLYRMLFGPHSEKTADIFPNTTEEDARGRSESAGADLLDRDGEDDDDGESDSSSDGEEDDGGTKGHGRRPANDYRGASRICIEHESLKSGERCPACGRGKVYAYRPRVVVRVSGTAPLTATLYEMQRLRCNLCGEIFTARPPPDAKRPKYDETAAAMIALLRYGSGLPHNRLSKLQASVGIPVSPSTQWDVVDKAALAPTAAYEELMRQAAGGKLVHNDDTKMPVLSLTGRRRAEEAPPDDPDDRTGTADLPHLRGALAIRGRGRARANPRRPRRRAPSWRQARAPRLAHERADRDGAHHDGESEPLRTPGGRPTRRPPRHAVPQPRSATPRRIVIAPTWGRSVRQARLLQGHEQLEARSTRVSKSMA